MDTSLNAPHNDGGGTLKGSKACFQKAQQQNDGCRRESKQMSVKLTAWFPQSDQIRLCWEPP